MFAHDALQAYTCAITYLHNFFMSEMGLLSFGDSVVRLDVAEEGALWFFGILFDIGGNFLGDFLSEDKHLLVVAMLFAVGGLNVLTLLVVVEGLPFFSHSL